MAKNVVEDEQGHRRSGGEGSQPGSPASSRLSTSHWRGDLDGRASSRDRVARTHGRADHALDRIAMAYEPAWSIGIDGAPATPEQLAEMDDVIRRAARAISSAGVRGPVRYGGGVRSEGTAKLLALADVDGLLVGRAAFDVEVFVGADQIIDTAYGVVNFKE